jgi:UDP-N-acetylglucosamine 2-epimerase
LKIDIAMKIVTIVGARPQFIKAAPVSRRLHGKIDEVLLHTGQHYDENMSRVFFDELDLPYPQMNLAVGSGSHGAQTGLMLQRIEEVLIDLNPDAVIVYGDTNSTLAGALASTKLHIPVVHIEAGLRSYNKRMPEEINRVLTDHASTVLFCPTQTAVDNLLAEGITAGVFNVGDVMNDALQYNLGLAQNRAHIFDTMGLMQGAYALATVHRPRNTDDPSRLQDLMSAFGELDLPVILPLHPRTRQALSQTNASWPANVRVIDPVGYLDMLQLESKANCILTDSGGVQKEAYLLGVRCITLREETEWPETVQSDWNRLVGTDVDELLSAFKGWHPKGDRPPYFGDGKAAEKIVDILLGLDRERL